MSKVPNTPPREDKVREALEDIVRLIHTYPKYFHADEASMYQYIENAKKALEEST